MNKTHHFKQLETNFQKVILTESQFVKLAEILIKEAKNQPATKSNYYDGK